jgi:hypothetical protein
MTGAGASDAAAGDEETGRQRAGMDCARAGLNGATRGAGAAMLLLKDRRRAIVAATAIRSIQ